MALYKLTKGSVSVIRRSKEGIREAEDQGYVLEGEVYEANGGYELVTEKAEIVEPKRKGRARAESIDQAESDGE